MKINISLISGLIIASTFLAGCETNPSSFTDSKTGYTRNDDPTTERGGSDLDCDDFSSQSEAQDFFESYGVTNDPHNLDRDGDGIACESI